MTKWENNIANFILKNKFLIITFTVTIISAILRYEMRAYPSGDYNTFLSPWFDFIKENGGFAALKYSIGDYSPPYYAVMALLTYLPFNSLTSIKIISIIFDYILAATAALIVYNILGRESKKALPCACVTYALVLFSPLVSFNSALWGQCDSIYVSFCLLCVLFLIKQRYLLSFIFYGIAFAFKMQAIFILPALLIYYFLSRNFSIKYFLLSPVMYFIMSMPAIIAGRPLMEVIKVYFNQTKTYSESIVLNFYNFSVLFQNGDVQIFSRFLIYITLAVLVLGCTVFIYIKLKPEYVDLIGLGAWSVWVCIMFLPHMHDRYGYLLEILIVIYSVLKPRYWPFTFGVHVLSLFCYVRYLTGYQPIEPAILSIISLILFFAFCSKYFMSLIKTSSKLQKAKTT